MVVAADGFSVVMVVAVVDTPLYSVVDKVSVSAAVQTSERYPTKGLLAGWLQVLNSNGVRMCE